MLFNSLAFVGFMAIVLAAYRSLGLRRQNAFLLVASYVFYGYWDWRFVLLLWLSTLVDFTVGQRLHRAQGDRRRKALLLTSLCANLGILSIFKYYDFFIDSAATLLTAVGLQPHLSVLGVVLPVGISFYTFQTLSYTIDIYRRRLEPVR